MVRSVDGAAGAPGALGPVGPATPGFQGDEGDAAPVVTAAAENEALKRMYKRARHVLKTLLD